MRVVLLTPMKVRCTLLALKYKSDVYVAWNSKIFPSETFDNVFSYQAELHKNPRYSYNFTRLTQGYLWSTWHMISKMRPNHKGAVISTAVIPGETPFS